LRARCHSINLRDPYEKIQSPRALPTTAKNDVFKVPEVTEARVSTSCITSIIVAIFFSDTGNVKKRRIAIPATKNETKGIIILAKKNGGCLFKGFKKIYNILSKNPAIIYAKRYPIIK
jgi:hypothetical protein